MKRLQCDGPQRGNVLDPLLLVAIMEGDNSVI